MLMKSELIQGGWVDFVSLAVKVLPNYFLPWTFGGFSKGRVSAGFNFWVLIKMTQSLEEDIPIKSCETDFNSELECAAEELCFQSLFE